jgi:uncharacterized protein (TIGR02646 family)
MIFVDRTRIAEPSRLKAVREPGLEHARRFFTETTLKARRQIRYFNPHWEDARKIPIPALEKLFRGKCSFCESHVDPAAVGVLDHFRPKWATRGLKGEFSLDHYWWLAYDWTNLYLTCPDCNKHRGPRFPVEGKRISGPGQDVSLERPLLLDPCADRPEEHLKFDLTGKVLPLSRRGDVTITLLGLNRIDLVRRRRSHIANVRSCLDAVARRPGSASRRTATKDLNAMMDPAAPYSACVTQVLRQQLAKSKLTLDGLDLKDSTGPAHSHVVASTTAQFAPRFIDEVTIKDFRGIKNLSLRAPSSDQSKMDWLMLIGENGAGKSSVLQAIALNLMSEPDRRALARTPRPYIRRGTRRASVSIRFRSDDPLRVLTITPNGFRCSEAKAAAPVMAYGATRLPPLAGMPSRRLPTENLFNPFAPLLDPIAWLVKLARSRKKAEREYFDYATHALAALLPERSAQWRFCVRRGDVRVDPEGTLRQLSDGYQSVISLAADIMATMRHDFHGGLEAAEGIAIVDELGAHLHPSWKMQLTSLLRAAFPRIQFIVTTHDPLCLRGLRNGEVAAMERVRGRVHARTDLPPIEGMRVEQILQSEFFGLRSTLDPRVERRFDRMYALKVKPTPSLTAKQRKELLALEEELAHYSVPGSTRAERLMLSEIERFLAKERTAPAKPARDKAWEKTQTTIALRMQRELGIAL